MIFQAITVFGFAIGWGYICGCLMGNSLKKETDKS